MSWAMAFRTESGTGVGPGIRRFIRSVSLPVSIECSFPTPPVRAFN